MSVIYFIFQQTMLFTIPLMIVALGGMFSERSGVVNIALEGIMTMGAFTGILFLNMTGGRMSGQITAASGHPYLHGHRGCLCLFPCLRIHQHEGKPDHQRNRP
ncbi:MAG: ABC transporter permease subunit [Enterocloster bolteae]